MRLSPFGAGLTLVLAAAVAGADETTYCNAFITALPYTITTQGHYCFDRNLSTAITTGNAITISSDYVVLDFNHFKLGGGSAGLGTQAVGVAAGGRRNVTVRNGDIRGFRVGIWLVEIDPINHPASLGYTVEDNLLDGNTAAGIIVGGSDSVVRRNIVTNTGNSTAGLFAVGCSGNATLGIAVTAHGAALAEDNVVSVVVPAPAAYGLYMLSEDVPNCVPQAAVAQRNVVHMEDAHTPTFGIQATVCRDDTVVHADTPYTCGASAGANVAFP
jgi:parallel beta-helix repeat protein